MVGRRVICYIWVGDLFGGMLRRICLVGGARICKGWRWYVGLEEMICWGPEGGYMFKGGDTSPPPLLLENIPY